MSSRPVFDNRVRLPLPRTFTVRTGDAGTESIEIGQCSDFVLYYDTAKGDRVILNSGQTCITQDDIDKVSLVLRDYKTPAPVHTGSAISTAPLTAGDRWTRERLAYIEGVLKAILLQMGSAVVMDGPDLQRATSKKLVIKKLQDPFMVSAYLED